MPGKTSSEDAKIGGITPEVLTFSGRCELCPPYMRRPTTRLAYCTETRRWPRSMKMMKATTPTMKASQREQHEHAELALAHELDRGRGRGGKRRNDAGKDDQRDAVADAALGDLLAEPHDEHAYRRSG